MPARLPPVVDGPIYPLTQQVYVENLLPDAHATVYENGVQLGTAVATSFGGTWVTLTAAPAVGRSFTATQTYPSTAPPIAGVTPGLASDHSNDPIAVLPIPNPLPTPVFWGWITSCTDALLMNGLLPGATLEVTVGGTTLLSTQPVATSEWFDLPATPLLTAGEVLEARLQTGGHPLGPVVTSLPVAAPGPLTRPGIGNPPLLDCATVLDFIHTTPGAAIRVVNATTTTVVEAPWNSSAVTVSPLVAGTLTAQQFYSRCRNVEPGPIAAFAVLRGRPGFPKVTYPLCTDVRQLTVTNLTGGELLTVYRVVQGQPRTVVGVQGVTGPTVTVNLPSSFQATDPLGPVSLEELAVTLCGVPSNAPGYTKVPFPASPGGPYPAPTVKPPLFACARAIQALGVHPGSLIQVFSAPTGIPRSAVTLATTSDPVITLWTPLIAGEQIFLEVHGCNTHSPSGRVLVHPLPSPLPQPAIAGPVLAGAPSVTVSDVVQGAQVYLFVDGVLRTQVDTNALGTFDAPVVLASGTPALVAGDNLQAVQALCSETSSQRRGQGGTIVVAPATPPPSGLASNFNYIFDSNCTNLLGVTVTFDVTHDILSNNGFTVQVNAYGARGVASGWQQYGFQIQSSQINGFVNNWPVNPTATPPDYFLLDTFGIVSLPSPTLPAGYRLTVALTYDTAQNVTGAIYTVVGGGTCCYGTQTEVLTSIGEPAVDVSAIVAFEVNVVEARRWRTGTTFSEGAGTITVSATNVLTALATEPPCAETSVTTGETANSVYGQLPSTPSTSFTQAFSVT